MTSLQELMTILHRSWLFVAWIVSASFYPTVLGINSLLSCNPRHQRSPNTHLITRPESLPSGPSWRVLSFTSRLMSLLLCRNFFSASWITSSVQFASLPHLSPCILCQLLVCNLLSLKNIYIFLVTKAVLFN